MSDNMQKRLQLTPTPLRWIRKGCMSVAIIVSILIFTVNEVLATEKDTNSLSAIRLIPEKQILDSLEYTNESLIAGFMTAAFGGNISRGIRDMPIILFADGSFRKSQMNFPSLQSARLKAEYPWLHEYIYRSKGEPKYSAINKWVNPINVGIGYPNDLKPFVENNGAPLPTVGGVGASYPDSSTVYCCATAVSQTVTEKITESIKSFLPAIQEMTGLNAEFIPRAKESNNLNVNLHIIVETGEKPEFANIGVSQRLKLADKGWRDRDGEERTGAGHETFRRYIGMHSSIRRYLLRGAVNFTPDFPYGVDGFLLPNEKNEIEQAFCFISDKLNEQQLRAAVGECLLRSLGLPELSGPIPSKESYRFLSMNLNPQPNVHPFLKIPQRYSEYDHFVARLLYSPEIKPGTTYNDVLKFLSGSQN